MRVKTKTRSPGRARKTRSSLRHRSAQRPWGSRLSLNSEPSRSTRCHTPSARTESGTGGTSRNTNRTRSSAWTATAGHTAWRKARRRFSAQRAISRASNRMGRNDSAGGDEEHPRPEPSGEHREQVGEVAGEGERVEPEEHHRPEAVEARVLVEQEQQRDEPQEQRRGHARAALHVEEDEGVEQRAEHEVHRVLDVPPGPPQPAGRLEVEQLEAEHRPEQQAGDERGTPPAAPARASRRCGRP